jgi:hypothetical protein
LQTKSHYLQTARKHKFVLTLIANMKSSAAFTYTNTSKILTAL